MHEKLYLSHGCKATIGEGMVVSIEPGIYISGKFGIRLENQVIVTQSSVEDLQDYPSRGNMVAVNFN